VSGNTILGLALCAQLAANGSKGIRVFETGQSTNERNYLNKRKSNLLFIRKLNFSKFFQCNFLSDLTAFLMFEF
jgi:hypothetical protein